MGLYGEEGRGKLRKASGRSKHPLIRRLPNGITQQARCLQLHSEFIGMQSYTQGTEPSKYLEEKKSNEIPLVVANERGSA